MVRPSLEKRCDRIEAQIKLILSILDEAQKDGYLSHAALARAILREGKSP